MYYITVIQSRNLNQPFDLWGTGLGYHLPILNPGSTVHTKLFIGSVAWLGGDLQYTNFILVVTVPT